MQYLGTSTYATLSPRSKESSAVQAFLKKILSRRGSLFKRRDFPPISIQLLSHRSGLQDSLTNTSPLKYCAWFS